MEEAPGIVHNPERGQRSQFQRREGASKSAFMIPNEYSPPASIELNSPQKFRAVFDVDHLGEVENPLGAVIKGFYLDREELAIVTPALFSVAAGQPRLMSTSWRGVDLDGPKGMVTPAGPMRVEAEYTREFMLKVLSPYEATRSGWYSQGETAVIEALVNPSTKLFLKWVLTGFSGYPGAGRALAVEVAGPMTVEASYGIKI